MRLSLFLLLAAVVVIASAASPTKKGSAKAKPSAPAVGKKTTKPNAPSTGSKKKTAAAAGQCSSGDQKPEKYTPAVKTKLLLNPEKGFYQDFAYPADKPDWATWKTRVTVVLAQYKLKASSDNGPTFVDLKNHLTDAKKNSIKLLLRFKYTDKESGDDDATYDKMIQDIGQIKKTLNEPGVSDALLTLQVGFIGAYGEWAFSKTLGFQHETSDVKFYSLKSGSQADQTKTDQHYAVAKAAFDALPSNGQIQMRQMNFRNELCSKRQKVPCDRIGIFNDCFMGGIGSDQTAADSKTNSGTFTDGEKPQLKQDGKKVFVTGEFCTKTQGKALADSPTKVTYANLEKEIRAQSFSILNNGVLPQILYSQNYYSKSISKSVLDAQSQAHNVLGYRFELESGSFPKQIQSGGQYCGTIIVKNTGATNLIYKHSVEVVLRSVKDKTKEFSFPVNGVDPKSWQADASAQSVPLSFTASNVPAGDYDVLLSLPDSSKDPAYRILMSNDKINEPGSRYNKLTTVTVA